MSKELYRVVPRVADVDRADDAAARVERVLRDRPAGGHGVAGGVEDHVRVGAAAGVGTITARSQHGHGTVTAQHSTVMAQHSTVTARSQHGRGTAQHGHGRAHGHSTRSRHGHSTHLLASMQCPAVATRLGPIRVPVPRDGGRVGRDGRAGGRAEERRLRTEGNYRSIIGLIQRA